MLWWLVIIRLLYHIILWWPVTIRLMYYTVVACDSQTDVSYHAVVASDQWPDWHIYCGGQWLSDWHIYHGGQWLSDWHIIYCGDQWLSDLFESLLLPPPPPHSFCLPFVLFKLSAKHLRQKSGPPLWLFRKIEDYITWKIIWNKDDC